MENFYEQIESYLLNELSVDERTAFEKALQNDPALALATEQHRFMMQSLDGVRLRQKVKSSIGEYHKASRGGRLRKFWLITLVALTGIGIAYLTFPDKNLPATGSPVMEQNPAGNDPAQPSAIQGDTITAPSDVPRADVQPSGRLLALADNYHLPPSETLIRSENNPAPGHTIVQKAADAYFKRQYRLTADILRADSLVKDDDNARFLRGSARFHEKQFSQAASDFKALENSFQYQYEARWNRMLCLLALDNKMEAQKQLDAMQKDGDFPFRAKAKELSDKMRQ